MSYLEQKLQKERQDALRAKREAEAKKAAGTLAMDSADSMTPADLTPAAAYALGDLRAKAAATVMEWVTTSDLAENETIADRLSSLVMGQCDMDGNGEIGDDENDLYNIFWQFVADFLQSNGATYEDVDTLINGDTESAMQAGERIVDLVTGELPDGADAEMGVIDSFAFDAESTATIFDAAYKKTVVVRDGKKSRVNKRVSGSVHLSGAQKAGLKRAQMKSHSARANMHRMKSMKLRKRMGL